jgi:hypothetical protein
LGRQFNPFTFFRTVNLGAFDYDSMRWQIDAPSESGSGAQQLQVASCKKVLHHLSVSLGHACVMDANPKGQHIFELRTITLFQLGHQHFFGIAVLLDKPA